MSTFLTMKQAHSGKGLEKILENSPDMTAQTLVEKIITEVKEHAGDEPAFDDVTVVVIKKDL